MMAEAGWEASGKFQSGLSPCPVNLGAPKRRMGDLIPTDPGGDTCRGPPVGG